MVVVYLNPENRHIRRLQWWCTTLQWLKGDLQDCGNSSFRFAQGCESPPITRTPCMGIPQAALTEVKTKVVAKRGGFFRIFFYFWVWRYCKIKKKKGNLEIFSGRSEYLEFREFLENWHHWLESLLFHLLLCLSGFIHPATFTLSFHLQLFALIFYPAGHWPPMIPNEKYRNW